MLTKKANSLRVIKNIYLSKNEPLSLIHFITNKCNARCSFCFIDFDDPEIFKGELTLDEIDTLTKNLGKSLLNVNLTGGEPFARKDIIEIAKLYIKNTTIQSIYITTNGSFPDRIESFAKEISSINDEIELCFQISIDDFPENHNKVRKIPNLFDKCIDSFKRLEALNLPNVNPVVSITVSHENCENVKDIFNYFHKKCNINAIKCCIVRDEGVYEIPLEKKEKIFKAYSWLTNQILNLSQKGEIKNYNLKSLQGRLHNKKDKISWDIISKTYMTPRYISRCHAASLFGIISADGLVYPCEILEDKLLGNLREHDMNFMKIWNGQLTKETRKFINNTKCNCTYECALSYNILGNPQYHPELFKAAINK